MHYGDVIMGAIASEITSLTIAYSTADQRKHQSSASLALVRWIHQGPVNSPLKLPLTRKMFPFDDVIMECFGSNTISNVSNMNFPIKFTAKASHAFATYDTNRPRC